METFFIVLLAAILVEALIEVLKAFVPDDANTPRWLWPCVGCILGILICTLANIDALTLLGIDLSPPLVGSILTGILISRGSNFVHDLWKRIKGDGVIETDI